MRQNISWTWTHKRHPIPRPPGLSKLPGVCLEYCGENLMHYNGTALYLIVYHSAACVAEGVCDPVWRVPCDRTLTKDLGKAECESLGCCYDPTGDGWGKCYSRLAVPGKGILMGGEGRFNKTYWVSLKIKKAILRYCASPMFFACVLRSSENIDNNICGLKMDHGDGGTSPYVFENGIDYLYLNALWSNASLVMSA